jgi:hypothetical protein
MYGTSELMVLDAVQPPTDVNATVPAPVTFGELMEFLESVLAISQMPQGTSRPASSYIRLDSMKPQANVSISGLQLDVERDTSPLLKAKCV